MIGGNLINNTLSVTSTNQLLEKTTRSIGADCLRQAYFNNNSFSAQIIDQNMRQIYAASTNTYNDTVLKGSVSINEILAE